jgi:hypothetical protein
MPKLVRDESFLKMIDEVVEEAKGIVDEVVEEYDEILQIVANPEQVIGKPYVMWTPQDKMLAVQIYGMDNPVLKNFIVHKEVESLKILESQVNQIPSELLE